MSWDKVQVGDTVTVEINRGHGGTVIGEIITMGDTMVKIGELILSKDSLTITDYTRGYRDGDVGVLEAGGLIYAGVYDSKTKAFHSGYTKEFTYASDDIVIVGNINDLEEK